MNRLVLYCLVTTKEIGVDIYPVKLYTALISLDFRLSIGTSRIVYDCLKYTCTESLYRTVRI